MINKALTLGQLALISALPVALGLGGCTVSQDEFANEGEDGDVASGKSDQYADPDGFYLVRKVEEHCHDCTLELRRINHTKMRCGDGTVAELCSIQTSELDWSHSQLTQEQMGEAMNVMATADTPIDVAPLIFRGDVTSDHFKVREAWIEGIPNAAIKGVFVRVYGYNHPAPTIHEAKLNSSAEAILVGIDFGRVGITGERAENLRSEIFHHNAEGILVAGDRTTLAGGKSRSVSQYWLRMLTPDW